MRVPSAVIEDRWTPRTRRSAPVGWFVVPLRRGCQAGRLSEVIWKPQKTTICREVAPRQAVMRRPPVLPRAGVRDRATRVRTHGRSGSGVRVRRGMRRKRSTVASRCQRVRRPRRDTGWSRSDEPSRAGHRAGWQGRRAGDGRSSAATRRDDRTSPAPLPPGPGSARTGGSHPRPTVLWSPTRPPENLRRRASRRVGSRTSRRRAPAARRQRGLTTPAPTSTLGE